MGAFADVDGGVANGLYDPTEAIIADADDDGRWENGEVVITHSDDGHLTAFTIEKIFPTYPAPNDFMELANHAEFIGSMSRAEMLAMFFVHDSSETQKWRIKGHAEHDFWHWVASWAVMLRKLLVQRKG